MKPLQHLLLFAFLLPGATATAAELRLAEAESVFAVVTHKAGFASGQAHNHFIAAQGYEVSLEAEPGTVEGASFVIELDAEDLLVDSAELQKTWYPRLAALGILDEAFGELSDKERDKIRGSMLSKKQLDVERFPKIRAQLEGVAAKPSSLGSVELGYEATLAFEVHGKTSSRPLAAEIAWDGETLHVEAAATFQFTDFGIEPFSAFLGAVKNTDEFHVYVSFTAAVAQ